MTQTPEHSAKISAAKMGVRQSQEHRAKLSAAKSGVPQTLEQRAARVGKRIFTDGTSRKFFHPGTEPGGWVIS